MAVDLNRINKLINIYKSAQRYRIIPDWAKRQNIKEPKEKFPGFMADIEEPEPGEEVDVIDLFSPISPTEPPEKVERIKKQKAKTINEKLQEELFKYLLVPRIFDDIGNANIAASKVGPHAKAIQLEFMTQAWAPKIIKFVVVDVNTNIDEVRRAYVNFLNKLYTKIKNTKTKEQEVRELEQATRRYWEHANKNPENTGYKQKVLQYNPEEHSTPHVNSPLSKVPDVPGHKGENYSEFQKMYLGFNDPKLKELYEKEKENFSKTEEERFEQAKKRLEEIDVKIKEVSKNLRSLLIDTKPYEAQGRNNNPSYKIKNKLNELKEKGINAKMVPVNLPKTPYGDELSVWYLARPETGVIQLNDLLAELQNLRANKENINQSLQDRERRLATLNIFNNLLKTAQDTGEDSPVIDAEKKEKSKIKLMEEAMLREARSKNTPLERLVQMSRLKKKFAVPAMVNFIEQAEKRQTPQFDFARDVLKGRIPKYDFLARDYQSIEKVYKGLEKLRIKKELREEFSQESPKAEDGASKWEVDESDYSVVSKMFTLWNMALAKFSRDMDYNPLSVLKNRKEIKRERYNKDEEPSILTHPAGEYSRNISNPKK